MKKTFSISIIAVFGFFGSIHTLGPVEYSLLQTEAKATTLNEASQEIDCEPDCIYKYPYLQSDHVDVQEKPEPVSIEAIGPIDPQRSIQPEQDLSEVPEEDEERFILESEACYKFDLKVEEEPAPKDESCYEIVIPPPTVVIIEGPGLDSPAEAQVIPMKKEEVPSLGETIPPVLPETSPFVSQNQELIPPPTEAPKRFQSQERPYIPFNAVPQPQEVLSVRNPLDQEEVSPSETALQNQDVIFPVEETREHSPNQEQPIIPLDVVPQSQEGKEVLPVESVENTVAPQDQQEIPPPSQKQEELPQPTNELQGPPPEAASVAPQDQQVIVSEESILPYQNPNEAQPLTSEPQIPLPEAVSFGPQNPEVVLPPPEETTGPYQTQEQPPISFNTSPQSQEGTVEPVPQGEEIPSSDWNQEQPLAFPQEQDLPLNESALTSQSREQDLPYATQEEVSPPPSDERAAIPPTAECEVVSGDHPDVVVVVESPENVNINYEEAESSPDRAILGRRRQKQIPLQEGWGDRYPIEEAYGPSQVVKRVPETEPYFGQEPPVEPVPSPELEERQHVGNEINNRPEYAEPLNRIGEARQGEQDQVPFEEGQAVENIGQEILDLPPGTPDLELPPFSREESFGVERISAEDYEGGYTPDQVIIVNPEPPLSGSRGSQDTERPEETFWQDRREQIPFEQDRQEVTNSDQEISSFPRSVPINQEIPPSVIEGQLGNERIPIEEGQGVVHYDEEVYSQDEGSPVNPEIPPSPKERANLRGYSPVEEEHRGNPHDQGESDALLNQPEEIAPYYEGERLAPLSEPGLVINHPEREFIPFETQEIIDHDEEVYNNPQQSIPPELEREINEALEYVFTDRISTGTTQIYGQPTTYLTYETYDREIGHEVAFTYVMTNIYSGIFKTDDYHYVVYGAGAVNFYNSHYGPKAEAQGMPSCSCNCNYQGYTFNYSFNL